MPNFRFFNGTTTTTIVASATDQILIGPKGSLLTGTLSGIVAKSFADANISVTIDGTVIAGGDGIDLDGTVSGSGNNQVHVTETGFVQFVGQTGIEVDGSGCNVQNDGIIHAIGDAIILAGDNGKVINTGHITSDGFAIEVAFAKDVQIDNSGVINGRAAGVDARADGLSFANTGTIQSDHGTSFFAGSAGANLSGDGMVISNAGLIAGSDAMFVTGNGALVTNSGRIEGSQTGLNISGDDNIFRNTDTVSSANDIAVKLDGKNWHVNNSGHIDSLNDDGVFFSGAAATTFKGFLRNSGTIEAGAVAVDLHFTDALAAPGSLWFLTNSGQILGGNGGIATNVLPVILFNSGTISTAVGIAYQATGQSLITNRGVIEGGAAPIGPVVALQLGGGVDQLKNFGEIHGDVLTGAGADVVRNGGLIDGTLDLGDGNDSYDGRFGSVDGFVLGGARNDVLKGGAQDDTMSGDAGDDKLYGRGGDDSLTGGIGSDLINGGAGDDTIDGGTGNDTMNGGTGQDVMTGGAGADVFVFESASDLSTRNAFDRIIDFQPGIDRIDLSAFGGLSFASQFEVFQKFVIYAQSTGLLQGDLDGDRVADFTLVLSNNPDLTAADLLL